MDQLFFTGNVSAGKGSTIVGAKIIDYDFCL